MTRSRRRRRGRGEAERARGELQATGEKLRERTVETRDELTAQERQTAWLARDGLSNPEIAKAPLSSDSQLVPS